MQPSEDASADSITSPSKSLGKKRTAEPYQLSPASKPLQKPSSGTPSTQSPERFPAASIIPPASKRLKVTQSCGSINLVADMSKMGVITRPGFVDLTRPSNFQPHAGAKRLVIKNLKATSRQGLDEYYIKTWNELDDALTSVFNREQPKAPLELLCRGVEATCRHGRAEKLSRHLTERCKEFLEKKLLPVIEKTASAYNVDALRSVLLYWELWNRQSTLLRSIFSYLDRAYLLTTKDAIRLEDQGIDQFRHAVFTKGRTIDRQSLGARVIAGMCELIEYDRTGQEMFDASLLKESISMLHIFGIYGKSFEPEFLSQSEAYFKAFGDDRSSAALYDYIASCDKLLAREALRCDTYNLDSTSKRSLLEKAQRNLIAQHSEILLNEVGISKLIDSNAKESLKALYQLLGLSGLQASLKTPWEAYINKVGSAIVINKEKAEDMVVRMLELKRSLDMIIRDSFDRDERFTRSLRDAFSGFINDSKNTSAWGTNNSKVGEMIAKYIDLLLRGGLKAVPRSLTFDAKDRDAAEKQGQAITGDEDAELDRQLEQGLELFRFIEGKDVFEAFYKKDLARRLLMARSASQDAERTMLAKLKNECGSSFTHNLEQMFKDQELARDEMIGYKQSLLNSGKPPSLDLQVSVLSSAAWPTYPDVDVKLPADVATEIEKYDRHYKHKHSGRKLAWKHALAHSVVKATFNKGSKELLVSAFQAIVLVLFNSLPTPDSPLSYSTILTSTGLPPAELQRTLQSLACAKFRILTKTPKGRDVNPTDTFTVNANFWDPKYRIKINQIQLKETKEENKETHERVYQDRQYETQAAIVRIMKARKEISHSELIAEVIGQTRKRGMVEVGEIKRNIEKLIEKDYIEREGSSYVYLA